MKKQNRWLEKYKWFIESWYEEVVNNDYFMGDDHADKVMLVGDIEDFWYFHHGVTPEETAEIDAKCLPVIYEAIKSRFPDMAEWFKDIIKGLKIDLSILEKQTVQPPQ
jgi:UDP-2,3-diacylglucosamine pyrophosphatase LpxH